MKPEYKNQQNDGSIIDLALPSIGLIAISTAIFNNFYRSKEDNPFDANNIRWLAPLLIASAINIYRSANLDSASKKIGNACFTLATAIYLFFGKSIVNIASNKDQPSLSEAVFSPFGAFSALTLLGIGFKLYENTAERITLIWQFIALFGSSAAISFILEFFSPVFAVPFPDYIAEAFNRYFFSLFVIATSTLSSIIASDIAENFSTKKIKEAIVASLKSSTFLQLFSQFLFRFLGFWLIDSLYGESFASSLLGIFIARVCAAGIARYVAKRFKEPNPQHSDEIWWLHIFGGRLMDYLMYIPYFDETDLGNLLIRALSNTMAAFCIESIDAFAEIKLYSSAGFKFAQKMAIKAKSAMTNGIEIIKSIPEKYLFTARFFSLLQALKVMAYILGDQSLNAFSPVATIILSFSPLLMIAKEKPGAGLKSFIIIVINAILAHLYINNKNPSIDIIFGIIVTVLLQARSILKLKAFEQNDKINAIPRILAEVLYALGSVICLFGRALFDHTIIQYLYLISQSLATTCMAYAEKSKRPLILFIMNFLAVCTIGYFRSAVEGKSMVHEFLLNGILFSAAFAMCMIANAYYSKQKIDSEFIMQNVLPMVLHHFARFAALYFIATYVQLGIAATCIVSALVGGIVRGLWESEKSNSAFYTVIYRVCERLQDACKYLLSPWPQMTGDTWLMTATIAAHNETSNTLSCGLAPAPEAIKNESEERAGKNNHKEERAGENRKKEEERAGENRNDGALYACRFITLWPTIVCIVQCISQLVNNSDPQLEL